MSAGMAAYTLPPEFPPRWASGWGEDTRGVFAEVTLGSDPATEATLELRWIPPGRFLMGSPEDEVGRWDAEGLQHEVTISRGFWLGAMPVTQGQWVAVLGGAEVAAEDRERPLVEVDWAQVGEFCAALNARVPGLGARLPSEGEWEYACRAGTRSAFNDGSACTVPEGLDPALEALGWHDKNSGGQTQPVGQKRPNGWGLHDMHGNVWEWCADWWEGRYPGGARVDPLGPEKGDDRVVRGGGWIAHARYCRSAFRRRTEPGNRNVLLGFRLAAGPELTGEAGGR